ncbi:MAG: hypothetical protein JRC86_11510 [Deltaproteobacteria bacterium]|nr:hypothetical protein [Deltaproteobacteria bacterium]
MSVKISDYAPVIKPLFEKDESNPDWECPVAGMEDVWVRINPPSWGVDRDRQQFVNGWHADTRLSLFDVAQMEISLCYSGTNMVVQIPKRDDKGRMVFIEEDPGYESETVRFDTQGQLYSD